jgi:hypothetical protein
MRWDGFSLEAVFEIEGAKESFWREGIRGWMMLN